MQRILPVMTKMDLSTLSQKFRGCMLGSLLGDCLGAPYEGDSSVSKAVLQQYFDKIEGPPFKAPIKQYTDDTAMTKCVAESLIDCRGFEPQDMAKKFVKEFFASPRRGYGQNVVRVFMKLKDQKCEDPFGPAKEQFDGAGSLGNGGAMRVAPVALFYHKDYPALIEKARKSALLTHTNKLGRDGAILQAIAVYQGLQSIPSEGLDATTFIKELMNKMHEIEDDDYGVEMEECRPYQKQLSVALDLLDADGSPDDINTKVCDLLGTNIAALYSVPTAVFCFLRALRPIPDIETENPFRRTLQYAISLGGDTDTIASMAGAIAGAYYGQSAISESLQRHCEGHVEVMDLADRLMAACNKP
ncbi:ADP-ribosylhydrolase ARH3-like [Schistocerca gregaria]|uniref:ADP-ribosylhydrolase ARH3-like n=1 Tax=Schistocerca gregaria TaxID=7010 RepID=UPI00211E923C|nr:ADP-ribosylhydrolase ARH3-like [Schistocerca gregaria]